MIRLIAPIVGVLVAGFALAATSIFLAPKDAESAQSSVSVSTEAVPPGISEQFFDEKRRAASEDVITQF